MANWNLNSKEALNDEQLAQVDEFRNLSRRRGLRTGTSPEVQAQAVESIKKAYAEVDEPEPQNILFARSPQEAVQMAEKLLKFAHGMSEKERTNHINSGRWFWGQCEFYWLAFYRFGAVIGAKYAEEQERRLSLLERLADTCYEVLSWDDSLAIVVNSPDIIKFDDERRLHSTDGPAVLFSDGYAGYFVHGVRLPPDRGAQLLAAPTLKDIQTEQNAEVRRVLVDIYDKNEPGRYLRDAGAKVVHEDTDQYGRARRLLRMAMPDDEDLVMVEVTNSTPEPDGTYKKYTIRVEPELRPMLDDGYGEPQQMTCHNAVASTFGKRGEEYHPDIET